MTNVMPSKMYNKIGILLSMADPSLVLEFQVVFDNHVQQRDGSVSHTVDKALYLGQDVVVEKL